MRVFCRKHLDFSLWCLKGFVLLGMVLGIAAPRQGLASVNATASTGNIIYPGGGYFYGPSIFLDSAGMHVYGCSPGTGGAWDFIRYQLSTDGGNTWSAQSVVLQPTAGSADAYSTCDPGVIEFAGYYYIGYTSTTNAAGIQNNVFVARSTSPTGPWDKWNGSGWGGNPQPFITYNGDPTTYGAGEPSFVVVGTTLYIYYSWNDRASNGIQTVTTRIATASTSNANWPGSITYQGTAITKRSDQGTDSDDVKYVDAYGKFIAVNTASRFGPKAYLQMWESTDGINFMPSNMGRDYMQPYLHNNGLSGDSSAHIDVTTSQYVGYAYGSQWANWQTYLNPIAFSNDSLPGKVDVYTVEPKNGAIRLEFQTNTAATSYTVKYGMTSGTYTNTVTGVIGSPYTLTGLTNGTEYFVAVSAVNANGTGASSSQVAATPQNYQLIAPSTATASSALSGWPVINVIDGNLATPYSSVEHTSASATEWVEVDYGSNQPIGMLVITARQNGFGAPTLDGNFDTLVQVSSDGSTWFNADYRLNSFPIIDDDSYAKTIITFPQPLYGRYIRLYSTKLNPDQYNNYYLQLEELQAYSVPATATASSSISGWAPSNILDTDVNTVYSSYPGDTTPWVQINLGSKQLVSGVNLTPRAGGVCFPIAFNLQSSTDGSTWTTIPGQSYTGYANPSSGSVQPFTFATPIQAQYIRLQATQLGNDSYGNPYLQIAGMSIRQSIPFTATASSQIPGWPVSGITDGVSSTIWSSSSHSSANSTEWVELDMGANHRVQDLRLVPRDQYCFPSAFTITYSTDGSTWTQVPGQNYTLFVNPASAGTTPNPVQLMWFSTPVTARYFKITATTLTQDNGSSYYFQLADVFVDQ